MDSFRFKDCTGFINNFRSKEWDRLVSFVPKKVNLSQELFDISWAWWLARVLALYSWEGDKLLRGVISKISEREWQYLIHILLDSYFSEGLVFDHNLFSETLSKVNRVYSGKMDRTLCLFFSEKESYALIQEQDPKWLMRLFHGLAWSKKSVGKAHAGKKKYCSDLLSFNKKNALLYELSQSLFKQIDLETESKDLISEIWSAAVQIMDLSVKMNNFENKDIWSLSFKALFNLRTEMSDYDFYARFTHQILESFRLIAEGEDPFILDHLTKEVWKSPPPSSYHKVYRDWITELFKRRRKIPLLPWEAEDISLCPLTSSPQRFKKRKPWLKLEKKKRWL